MKWIETDKQKPEFNIPVLAYCRIYGVGVRTYVPIDEDEPMYGGNWKNHNETGILPPTHWMYMPKPPNDKIDNLPF